MKKILMARGADKEMCIRDRACTRLPPKRVVYIFFKCCTSKTAILYSSCLRLSIRGSGHPPLRTPAATVIRRHGHPPLRASAI